MRGKTLKGRGRGAGGGGGLCYINTMNSEACQGLRESSVKGLIFVSYKGMGHASCQHSFASSSIHRYAGTLPPLSSHSQPTLCMQPLNATRIVDSWTTRRARLSVSQYRVNTDPESHSVSCSITGFPFIRPCIILYINI